MSQTEFFLGIDLGSSSVKTTLFSPNEGRVVDSYSFPENEMEIISIKKGWAEQEPNYWWECVKKSLLYLKKRNDFRLVKAIGISYQMHGLVAVDKNGETLMPSIIWCDSRAVEIGRKAEKNLDNNIISKKLLNSPGNFTASKIRWVIENDPEKYGLIYKIMLPGDFIAFKLTGKINTTASGLSEGIMWDFDSNSVSREILELYKIDSKIIPNIVETIGNQGSVSEDKCKLFGFRKDVKITYRSGDQPNNAFSLNVLNPGEIAATAGTSAVIYSVTDKNIYDPNNRINTFLHSNNTTHKKRNGLLLCINGSGIAYSWIKSILNENSYLEMDKKSESVKNSKELKFYPFGNGVERLFKNKKVDSHIVGLDFKIHNKSHIIRSVLEGISFSLSYGVELLRNFGVDVNTVKVGNANLFQSKIFKEAFVNTSMVNLKLYNTNGSEGAARGAALGFGYYKNEEDTFKDLKLMSEVSPSNMNSYLDSYNDWKKYLNKLN